MVKKYKCTKKGKKTARDYELLALSRMTGEQIMNEPTPEERKEYEKFYN